MGQTLSGGKPTDEVYCTSRARDKATGANALVPQPAGRYNGGERTVREASVMPQVTLSQAQLRLEELLQRARTGELVEIVDQEWTYRLSAVFPRPARPRPPVMGIPQAGRLKG